MRCKLLEDIVTSGDDLRPFLVPARRRNPFQLSPGMTREETKERLANLPPTADTLPFIQREFGGKGQDNGLCSALGERENKEKEEREIGWVRSVLYSSGYICLIPDELKQRTALIL